MRLIEYMDVGGASAWSNETVLTAREIRAVVESEFPLVPLEDGQEAATAVNYRHTHGRREVRFIASISQPFCGCVLARTGVRRRPPLPLPLRYAGADLKPWLGDAVPVVQLAAAVRARWRARRPVPGAVRDPAQAGFGQGLAHGPHVAGRRLTASSAPHKTSLEKKTL
ncbi:molybdenum cofactor biosynthesis enzyme MoaA [Paraburkholderia sp. UCT70]|uniref:hypothetical protein n=1 Tax=Paraburkholderia sp. UCT70 TaxID=2991068 RepID=UPI003D214E83